MENIQFADKEIFIQRCDEIFANETINDTYTISSIFYRSSNDEEIPELKNSLELMGHICFCWLDAKRKDIFQPLLSSSKGRSFIPEDLNSDQLNYLKEVVDGIKQPILKSRIADILWSYYKPKNITYARTAIENYIVLDFSDENYDFWHRASSLAVSTKQNDYLEKIKSNLIKKFNSSTNDGGLLLLRIADIFLETNLDENIFGYLAEKIFSEQQKIHQTTENFNIIENYLITAEKLFYRAKNKEKIIECIYLQAQATEKHGDLLNLNPVTNHFYNIALQIYRKIPDNYREKYNLDLDNIQNKIIQSRKEIPIILKYSEKQSEDDIDIIKKDSINSVKNKNSPFESLYYFSNVFDYSIYRNYMKEKEKEDTVENVFSGNFSKIPMDSLSRRIIGKPIDNSLDLEISNFPSYFIAETFIIPALEQIQTEYIFSKNFLVGLCNTSPIIPENRKISFATALYYGFEWDFMTCIHLLAPQVENMVRELFQQKKIITTNINQESIENEIGLSSLLKKDKAKDILGEDLWLELQTIFTSPYHSNLRNQVAHGLLNDNTCYDYSLIYAWWMILRWIVRSIVDETKET